MTWDTFSDGLAATLSELEERTTVTLSWSAVPTVYVQFSQTPEALTARTGADDVLPESAVSQQLAAQGWEPPSTDPLGQHTWHTSLGWPPRSAQYAALAKMCVGVLRDLNEVPSPKALEYRAWRDSEEPAEGAFFYEDELEPAELHLVLSRLDISDAGGDSAESEEA